MHASVVTKKEREFVEVWSSRGKLSSVNVTAKKLHGKIYADSTLGGMAFAPIADDTHILYVAEEYRKTSTSYFEPSDPSKTESASDVRGEQFDFREDWGEQLRGESQPILAVLDYEEGHVSVLENVPPDISPAQVKYNTKIY